MSSTITLLLQTLLAILVTSYGSPLHYFQNQPVAFYSAQPHYQLAAATQPSQSVAHPAVVANSLRESELPSELLKSERFYKNPQIAAALAKESWFTDKEMPVIDREAEKIPREMIYKIFHNAGWIKRR